MADFNTAVDSQQAYAAMPNGGLPTTSTSGTSSGLTAAQQQQMAQLAAQMLVNGFKSPPPSMGGTAVAVPQGTATQAPNAGQFITAYGGR